MKADTKVILAVGSDKFQFSRFEVPEHIPFGGSQMLVVHKLIGGKKSVQAMGRDDKPLEWSGMFQGKNALDRARYLDYLRISAAVGTLTWSEFSYQVVIRNFDPDFQRFYQIPYKITFEVISDNSGVVAVVMSAGIDELIAEDMNSADGVAGKYANLKSAWAKVKSTYQSCKKMAKATTDQINSYKRAISDAQAAVKNEIASVSNTMQQITTLGGVFPNNGAARYVSKTSNQATNMAKMGELHNLQFTLGRLSKNVAKQ